MFCMVTYGPHDWLGHPASHSACACTCAYTTTQGMDWGLWPPLLPLRGTPDFPWVSVGVLVGPLWPEQEPCGPHACLLTPGCLGLTSRSTGRWVVGRHRVQPLGAPVYMCFHSLSLQGSDLPLKTTTSTFFLLYFDKTLKKLELLNFILGKTSELVNLVSWNLLLLSVHN